MTRSLSDLKGKTVGVFTSRFQLGKKGEPLTKRGAPMVDNRIGADSFRMGTVTEVYEDRTVTVRVALNGHRRDFVVPVANVRFVWWFKREVRLQKWLNGGNSP